MSGLLPSFYRYMESSRHLLLYRLDSTYTVPATLRLPHVETLSLVHCAPESIVRFLHPSYFPSVKRIHYLSAGPADTGLHRRFGQTLDWVFPMITRSYGFYDNMVEAGWGRREQGLIGQYLVSSKMINGQTWFDLYLPMRGMVYGEWYAAQQMAYFHKKHCDGLQVSYPIREEYIVDMCRISPLMKTDTILDSRWLYEQHCMMRTYESVVLNCPDSNHPDATPCHSSGK